MDKVRHVTIQDMLAARDERAARQNALRERYHAPVVSFTMNIPGSIKNNSLIRRAFSIGKERIIVAFEKMHAEIHDVYEKDAFTGCEAMWTVRADAVTLKITLCLIEEMDELGRLFDMDVIDSQGNHLSRNEERGCLICHQPARVCARSRKHCAEELFAKTQEIIIAHLQKQFIRKNGELVQRALLYEAITTPKPGLVDCASNGAHHDMNLFHFMESAAMLREYFEKCTLLGMKRAGYEALQLCGMEAEKNMLSQLGVNTHKGAVFALGILSYARGVCGEDASVESVLSAAAVCGRYFLQQMEKKNALETGGELQYAKYGITGARGEAASGFETVKKVSLPVFLNALRGGKTLNDAGLCAMIALMAHVQDSNVIRRGGMEAQKWMQSVSASLASTSWNHDTLKEIDQQFIEKNISPGGCADLLAVTYYLYFIGEDKMLYQQRGEKNGKSSSFQFLSE
ncbi:MAG: citrate lyase holo-[Clostridia bacterium]|nr:citrate lyase holo-[acyl-carrier protein] synthase [Clostridia bacterium]